MVGLDGLGLWVLVVLFGVSWVFWSRWGWYNIVWVEVGCLGVFVCGFVGGCFAGFWWLFCWFSLCLDFGYW